MILTEVMEHLQQNLTSKPRLEKIVINSGFSGMLLDDGAMGLAMNIRSGGLFNDPAVERFLMDKPGQQALEVAWRLHERAAALPSGSNSALVLRSLLVALLNALSRPLLNETYLSERGYHLTIGAAQHASQQVVPGETVTIIGFGGMVRNVAQIAGTTYVSELEPDLFKSRVISQQELTYGPKCAQVISSSEAAACFQESDTVFVTGCTLVSDTMEEVLAQCQGRRVVVYGHTAAMYPEPLFKRGVNVISTGRVTDSALMADLLTDCAGAVERFFPQATEDVQIWK